MDSQTNLIQGSLIIQKRKVHGAYNCLVVPDSTPEDWYFKQFPNEELIFDFAREFNLAVRREDGNQSE